MSGSEDLRESINSYQVRNKLEASGDNTYQSMHSYQEELDHAVKSEMIGDNVVDESVVYNNICQFLIYKDLFQTLSNERRP